MVEEEVFKVRVRVIQGKITIPVYIRKFYNLKENEFIEIKAYKDYMTLKPTGSTVILEGI